jgi:hypothetical protein
MGPSVKARRSWLPPRVSRSRDHPNECWREDSDKVGAGDLNFQDNHSTAATLLAEAEATAPEIAEAMCWSVEKAQKMLDTYSTRISRAAARWLRTRSRSLRTTGTRTKRPPMRPRMLDEPRAKNCKPCLNGRSAVNEPPTRDIEII